MKGAAFVISRLMCSSGITFLEDVRARRDLGSSLEEVCLFHRDCLLGLGRAGRLEEEVGSSELFSLMVPL